MTDANATEGAPPETAPPDAVSAPTLRARLVHRVASAALHVLLAVLVTWPMALHPTTVLVGHPEVDVWNHAWGPWWFSTAFHSGIAPLWTQLLAAPSGGWLWYIDPIGALVGAPLVPLLGAVAAYNFVVLFNVLLASVGGRVLGRSLGASPSSSWLAAVGVAASPFLISEIHNGVSEAHGLGWTALALAVLARATSPEGRVWHWLGFGALGAVVSVGATAYGLALLIGSVLLVVGSAIRRPLATLVGSLAGGALGGALVYPVYRLIRLTLDTPGEALIYRPERPWGERMALYAHNAVDPRSFFWMGDFQSVDYSTYGESFRHSSYLGFIALGLAIAARRGWWLAAVLVGIIVSLGPFAFYDGAWYTPNGRMLALPFRVLIDYLPTSLLGHPQRIGMPAIVMLAGLAAAGAAKLPVRAHAALAVVMLVELLVLAPSPWPLSTAPATPSALHARIREDAVARGLQGAAAVFDLPGDVPTAGMTTSRYLLAQTWHWQPIPYVPDARANTCRLNGQPSGRAIFSANTEANAAAMVADLKQNSVGWVVVHQGIQPMPETVALLTSWLGEPEVFGEDLLWIVPNPRPMVRRAPVGGW